MPGRLLFGALLMFTTAAAAWAEMPAAEPLCFTFMHADPVKAKVEPYPFFRVFPDGKDKNGEDASGTLDTLKFARGESKLYKEHDRQPGLIVVLRRLILLPLASGDYKAILEGEYNAVQTVVDKATMESLLSGKVTDLVFASESTRGVRPVAFTIKAKTVFRAALVDGHLHVYGGEGASTIMHYTFSGTYTYESDPVPLGPKDSSTPIYIGRSSPLKLKRNREPETLPVIN
jgi:hypothetical protein